MTYINMSFDILRERESVKTTEVRVSAAILVNEHEALTNPGKEVDFAIWTPGANAYAIWMRDELKSFFPMDAVHAALRRRSNTVEGAEGATLNYTLDQIESLGIETKLDLKTQQWRYKSLDIRDSLVVLKFRPETDRSFGWRISTQQGGTK